GRPRSRVRQNAGESDVPRVRQNAATRTPGSPPSLIMGKWGALLPPFRRPARHGADTRPGPTSREAFSRAPARGDARKISKKRKSPIDNLFLLGIFFIRHIL